MFFIKAAWPKETQKKSCMNERLQLYLAPIATHSATQRTKGYFGMEAKQPLSGYSFLM
jgi:hypothetical protein